MLLVASFLAGCLPEAPSDSLADIVVTGMSSEETALSVQIAHEGPIEQALMAQRRSRGAEVRILADREIEEHTKAAQQLATVMRQLSLTPSSSQLSQRLEDENIRVQAELDRHRDREFDRAYLDATMLGHSRMLGLIDNILARRDDASDYHLYLERTRTVVYRHFIVAESLRDSGIVR